MNYIKDSRLGAIEVMSVAESSQKMFGRHWHTKTAGEVKASLERVLDGVRVRGKFTGLGYLYLRQVIPDVMKFSGKNMKIKVRSSIGMEDQVGYDVYIQARMTENDAARVLVVDTPTRLLSDVVEVEFEVPDLSKEYVNENNGLSVAFRLVGRDEEIDVVIHSIEVTDDQVVAEKESWFKRVIAWFKNLFGGRG